MVIHNGKRFFAKGFGLADLEETPATNTNFRLASVSKAIYHVAVLILVKFVKTCRWTRGSRFFRVYALRQITVRHLLHVGLLDYQDLIPPGDNPVLDRDVLRF